MPPIHSRPSAPALFFVPRPRRSIAPQNYANIERPQFNPHNPPSSQASSTLHPLTSTNPPNTTNVSPPVEHVEDDTITVQVPPGHDDYDSDEEMLDVEANPPSLTDTPMTDIEKAIAIAKWRKDKQAHIRKKRTKNSHVYWYMQRETIHGSFYSDLPIGPKILQQFKWSCTECLREPHKWNSKFTVLESNRRGVTSGMGKHLKVHGITKDTHFSRIYGYGGGVSGGDYTELDAWSGRPRQRARLTSREATRRWFVKTRQPFSTVESDEFQEMFLAHNTSCSYKSRLTLRNHIFDDLLTRRQRLKTELEYNCVSISFTLDIWTAPNRTPIFVIIGHWLTADVEEREEVFEFVEVKGSHTGDTLAQIVQKTLDELNLNPKLFAVTGDNAGNNGTLCEALYKSLKLKYDDRVSPIGKPQMRFHGRPSWVRCLAHVVALICDDVLKDLKAGTAKEAKKLQMVGGILYLLIRVEVPLRRFD